MAISEGQETTTVSPGQVDSASGRSLVLVAGSGRSGTSLFTGILQRLGFSVPQPEVPADDTNPRGFAESQWVVDFHTRLLKKAGVLVADARPEAWALTAEVAIERPVQQELRRWLEAELQDANHVVIKDPRLSWFLPLWQRCAEDAGVAPRFATVLRHPAAVLDSKVRSYGGWRGEVDRTAGWLNQVLFTERATREGLRVFVRYDDLLDDWTRTIAHLGERLDLTLIREAPATSIVRIHEFVDRGLRRSRTTWDDFDIPASLREQADDVWRLMNRLADETEDQALAESLERARGTYIAFYQEAEAIAQSSITAARWRALVQQRRLPARTIRLVRWVPERYRRKVPPDWRAAVVRALTR